MLARSYVNRISDTNRYCNTGDAEVGTITRGADWYEVIGGMQDYGYLRYGTLEMTMEISCCKYPFSNVLASYWSYNRDAMVELLLQAQRGSSSNRCFLTKRKLYNCSSHFCRYSRISSRRILSTDTLDTSDDRRSTACDQCHPLRRVLARRSTGNLYLQSTNDDGR